MAKTPPIRVRGSCRKCGRLVETKTEQGRVQAKVPCPDCGGKAGLVVCRRVPKDRAATSTPPATPVDGPDDGVIEVPKYRTKVEPRGRPDDSAGRGDAGQPESKPAGGPGGAGGGADPGVREPGRRRWPGFPRGRRGPGRADDPEDYLDWA